MKNLAALFAITAFVGGGKQLVAAEKEEPAIVAHYYTKQPQFHPAPEESKATQTIDRFGPVGIGIELRLPAFQMLVKNVEDGSPAAASGKLKAGQFIESINGQILKDIDPRLILGGIVAKAEETDGVVKFMVKETADAKAQEVIVKIPVLGAYSKTWPMNCPKSDKIVRNFADWIISSKNEGWGANLFLLSTGEQKDLDEVRRRFSGKLPANMTGHPWFIGYNGPTVCEYYLLTGDASVLPAIKSMADQLKKTMYNGGWAGRGGVPFLYNGGGHLNAAGVHCVTFLLLAKECGVDVDEYTLQESLKHFYRFAGRGNTPYGDGLPESGFVDNGKVGGLAFAMAAATSLMPEREDSVYAKARDISAVKSFYSTSWMNHGHTGGGIGEIWRSSAMGLIAEKKPTKYREFMDARQWHYDLSRRFDGSFGVLGGQRYDEPGNWGNFLPLAYTIPRKKLQLFGAPKTKYCKTYQLPTRPWGTAADDEFYSLEPSEYAKGKVQNVDAEKFETDASSPIGGRLRNPDVSDEVLLMYAHHPDQGVREMASWAILRKNRFKLVLSLLRDKDPRARMAGITAIPVSSPDGAVTFRVTDEMIGLLIGMVNDPNESWWVVQKALNTLVVACPQQLAPHIERLDFWLKSDEWWLSKAAVAAVTPLAADKQFAGKILPIIGNMLVKNEHAVATGPVQGVIASLYEADPEVQKLAVDVFADAYKKFPAKMVAPGGANMQSAVDALLGNISGSLAGLPGGFEKLHDISKSRFPTAILPHEKLYLAALATNSPLLKPELKKELNPVLLEELIPEYIAKNCLKLLGGNKNTVKRTVPATATEVLGNKYRGNQAGGERLVDAIEDLTQLYRKADVHDYDWHNYGPDRLEMKWNYHQFEPKEQRIWTNAVRFRKVTYPAGMEKWFTPGFDTQKAGWQSGFAPFGSENGKLRDTQGPCKNPICRCGDPMKTLWDTETLLLNGSFEFPPMKEGYRYRILIGGGSHVGSGDGYAIFVDGKLLVQDQNGAGKGQGGVPRGAFIDSQFAEAFNRGKVTIAATGFLYMHAGKYTPIPWKGGFMTIWLEEMKMPPLGIDQLIKSTRAVPLLSSRWQAKQNDENRELQSDDDKFKYDGKFVANPKLLGSWSSVCKVQNINEFKQLIASGNKIKPTKNANGPITFKDNGSTNDALKIWSGDTLMDITGNQALKITIDTINGSDYLFLEEGGFNTDRPDGWNTPLNVMRRVEVKK